MKNVITIVVLTFLISGCTSINFNKRYKNANWDTVLIAPLTGPNAQIVDEEIEHALATSDKITVVSSNLVKLKLKEFALMDEYNTNPTAAILQLAKEMNADGIVIGSVETQPSKSTDQMTPSYSSIYVKLLDTKDMSIVFSSRHESHSFFSTPKSLLQYVSHKTIDELEKALSKLDK
ncbi:hypothetical protein J3L16_01285 [Alteromonas sp. 5E99-2]|uniref:hypothetical protein n=1 Tax=Alteromonas sp. 5E99-2 TaxID=2817683 RepID=UPI001A990E6D|nr:hypothetical protein [Alteromonas sp. 5E99-2]MBO1254312.1 hypothetical protein [Alteromonas sp. 5E99-2]